MKRGTFRAITAAAFLGLVCLVGFLATRPAVRRALDSFIAPLPPLPGPSSKEAPSALPLEVTWTGGESRELQRLRSAPDAGAVPRIPREALFPSRTQAEGKATEHMEALHRPEMIRRDDSRIDAAVSYLAHDSRGHAALISAWKRSGRYRPTMDRVLRAWSVPEDLVAIATVESAFVATAVQPDGSAGLWSLPKDVAQAYGLTVADAFDERRALEASTEVAGRFLADLKERFGSWPLAVLAFGCGYQRAATEIGGQRSHVFEDMADQLPASDVSYVFQVFAVATVFANPERFGLDAIRADPPIATSDMEVPAQAPLSLIARAAGTSPEHLRELNPEYLGDIVPTTGSAMIVHLPTEGLARAKELLTPLLYAPPGSLDVPAVQPERDPAKGRASEPSAAATPGTGRVGSATEGRIYYRVRDGETLASLAEHFGVATETIASDNALDVASPLRAGQLLTIRPGQAPSSNRK
jgi:membrane-bound lytic murein transglycosylase D